MRRELLLLLACLLPGAAVAQEALQWTEGEVRVIALHGPWPPAAPVDPSNRVTGRPEAILFGQYLFNEPRLSASRGMSCADCHQSGRDWRDGRARGLGAAELDRRTPTLWNVGYQHWFGWDGAADSLWMQSIRPIVDPREMGTIVGAMPDAAKFARGLKRRGELADALARARESAATKRSPGERRSASGVVPVSSSTRVPGGTLTMTSSPLRPWQFDPMPCCPRWPMNCLR